MDRMEALKLEMSAMRKVYNILEKLDTEAQRRVLAYVVDRCGAELAKGAGRQLELADDKDETRAG